VTHLYEFAHGFCEEKMDSAIFLRAERQADGLSMPQRAPAEDDLPADTVRATRFGLPAGERRS
jgi:hypothetical protein